MKSAEEIFDLELMARYYAICDFLSPYHGLVWHNQRYYYNPVTGLLTQFRQIGNPVGLIQMKDETESSSLFGTASLDFNIIKDKLTAKALYGNNYESSFRDFFIPSTTNWFDDYRSRASLQWAKRQYQTFETYVTYVENFNDVMSLNAVAGIGQYVNDFYTFGVQGLCKKCLTDCLCGGVIWKHD